MLTALAAALVAFRHPEPQREAGPGTKGNGVVARCQCGRQFRVSASVLEDGPIMCAVCGTPFENTTPEAAHTGAGDEQQQEGQ